MTERSIEVGGRATTRVAADVATARVSIEASGTTGPEASDRLTDRYETVVEALGEAGVPRDHIHIEQYTVGDDTGLFGDDDDTEVEATHVLTFDCSPRNLRRFSQTAVGAGATIDSVEFQAGDERRDAIHDQLLETAVEQAHRRAETMATAHDVSLGRLRTLTLADPNGFSSVVDDALDAVSDANLSGGPIEASVGVRATYDIEQN